MDTKTTQFKTLYNLHAEELYRFCFFRIKSKETSEDIVAESFAELYKIDFAKIENQRAWLFKVCRNIMYDTVFRTASKYTATFENQDIIEDFPENLDIAQVTIDAEMVALIKSEIEKLDPIASEIILLKIWEDLSFREIAEVTLMNENTVKQRFYRSLALLKNNVDQNNSIKLNSFSLPIIAAGVFGISKMPSFALTTNLLPSIMTNSGIIAGGAAASTIVATGLFSTGFAQVSAAVIASAAIAFGSVAGIQYFSRQNEQNVEQVEILPIPELVDKKENDADKPGDTDYKQFDYTAINISFEIPENWNLITNNNFLGINGDVRVDFYNDNKNGSLEEFARETTAGAARYFPIQSCFYTSSNPIEYKTNAAGIRYAENTGVFKSNTTNGTCGLGQGEALPSQGVPAKIYMIELNPAITGSDLKFMTIGSTEGEFVGTKNDIDVKRLVESIKYVSPNELSYVLKTDNSSTTVTLPSWVNTNRFEITVESWVDSGPLNRLKILDKTTNNTLYISASDHDAEASRNIGHAPFLEDPILISSDVYRFIRDIGAGTYSGYFKPKDNCDSFGVVQCFTFYTHLVKNIEMSIFINESDNSNILDTEQFDRIVREVKYSAHKEPIYKTFKSDRYNISFNYSADAPVVKYQDPQILGNYESATFADIGISVSWGNFIGGWGPCPDNDKLPTFTTKSGHTFNFCTSVNGQTGRISIGGAIQVGTDENNKPILIVIESIPSTEFVDKAKLISELSIIIESLQFNF